MKEYFAAVKFCLFHKWFYCPQDAVCGNGFQIFAYGLWLILKYALELIVRIFVALTAPVMAILVLRGNRIADRRANKSINDL